MTICMHLIFGHICVIVLNFYFNFLGNSVVLTEDTDKFIIGNRIWVGGTKPGQIAYIGETNFGNGDWAGIVLDEPIGNLYFVEI